MKLNQVLLGVAAVSLLAGCSVFERKQVDYKAGAIQTPSLEVPPDLTVPATDPRYVIPGTDGERVASYSEYTQRRTEQPCVGPASASAVAAAVPASAPAAAEPVPAPTPAAKLLDSNGNKSISTGEPFDRSWRRVGLALDRAHLMTTDKDRSKGIFYVAAPVDKNSKEKRPDYQVVVRETDGNCEVSVVDQNGKSDADTTRLVEVLFQNLDKNDRGGFPGGDAIRGSR